MYTIVVLPKFHYGSFRWSFASKLIRYISSGPSYITFKCINENNSGDYVY